MLDGSLASVVVPLQSISAPSNPVELFVFVTGFLTIAIGIAIAYVAFRGYRRNESRPMLFIAIGFVLAIALPGTLQVVLYVIVLGFGFQLPVDTTYVVAVFQLSSLFGMAAILYALVMQ